MGRRKDPAMQTLSANAPQIRIVPKISYLSIRNDTKYGTEITKFVNGELINSETGFNVEYGSDPPSLGSDSNFFQIFMNFRKSTEGYITINESCTPNRV